MLTPGHGAAGLAASPAAALSLLASGRMAKGAGVLPERSSPRSTFVFEEEEEFCPSPSASRVSLSQGKRALTRREKSAISPRETLWSGPRDPPAKSKPRSVER